MICYNYANSIKVYSRHHHNKVLEYVKSFIDKGHLLVESLGNIVNTYNWSQYTKDDARRLVKLIAEPADDFGDTLMEIFIAMNDCTILGYHKSAGNTARRRLSR